MTYDPWDLVEDLDGLGHYRVLGLSRNATSAEVKKAYRELVRTHHPDKGGGAAAFARLQRAFEVLSDPKQRQVYDLCARDPNFKYVPRHHDEVSTGGGESALLSELDSLGLHCEPQHQVVVTCELCRRPATKECWICGMMICNYCTRRQHWKGEHDLHWPLVNTAHMLEKLARRELEKKRLEDAKKMELQHPDYRNEYEVKVIRSCKEAAYKMLARENRQCIYDQELARFYMWAQTSHKIYIAVHVPTGVSSHEVKVELSHSSLLVQSPSCPPVVDRLLAGALDPGSPVDIHRSKDNRLVALTITKATPGEAWYSLFKGDSDGVRCLRPPYSLDESRDDEVMVEISVPFWIDRGDVRVSIEEQQLKVAVRKQLYLTRTYWRNRDYEQRYGEDYHVVVPGESSWTLTDVYQEEEPKDSGSEGSRGPASMVAPATASSSSSRGPASMVAPATASSSSSISPHTKRRLPHHRMLTINLIRPPPTEEEMTYKKGVRQDNKVAERPCPSRRYGRVHQGVRFFIEDEDEFGLENVLMAMMFRDSGTTFCPSRPWDDLHHQRQIGKREDLPEPVQRQLEAFAQNE